MSSESSNRKLLSDAPLTVPDEDLLGYSSFSADLASTINGAASNDEFVVGIYGPWGSGKSTALNFLEHYLNQKNSPPVIVRFNPWWFSGEADLLERFFSHVETELETEEEFDQVRAKLSNFSSALSNVPLSAATGVPTQRLLLFLSRLLDPEPDNVEELKQDISEDLKAAEKRIVVFIDDIDRLAEDEMAQMFRLVKSVADFPNITYILAFDHNVVVESLEREHIVRDGEEYLDKIIQLPQHLPIPEEGSLDEFFADRLQQVVNDEELEFDRNHWQNVYSNGILPTLTTPRDAVRLSNSVITSYGRLRSEANFVDLVCVETLRLFYTDAYEYVREHRAEFVNEGRVNRLNRDDDFSEFFDMCSASNAGRERLEEVLTYLFPRIDNGSFMGSRYQENYETFRRRKRICHPEVFPFYFRQTIPSGELPSSKIESLVGLTDRPAEFANELRQLSEQEGKEGRSKANRFLKRFSDYTHDLTSEQTKAAIKGLFIAGDELCAADPSMSLMDSGSKNQLVTIIRELLHKIEDQEARFRLLNESISESTSHYLSSVVLILRYRDHGEMGGEGVEEEERLLNYNQVEELTSVWIESIESTAEAGNLAATPELDVVLSRWHEWSASDQPQQWVEENTETTDELLGFLSHFIQQGQYASRSKSGVKNYFDPSSVEPFLDPAEVEERLEALDDNDLNDWQQQTAELFMKGKEFSDKGKDPSNFTLWHIGERGE